MPESEIAYILASRLGKSARSKRYPETSITELLAHSMTLSDLWNASGWEKAWLAIGLGGQLVFTGRFVVQWIVSERKKRSVIPVAFWYLSMVGSLVLLSYAIYKRDPVFILGFSLNSLVYVRNLWLIRRSGAVVAEK